MAWIIFFFMNLRSKNGTYLISFLFLLFIFFNVLLFPLPANGKDGNMDDTILRMNSEIRVEINEVYNSIISLNGPVDIRGRVVGNVISIGKPVYVHGEVGKNVLVLGADIVLAEGSAIRNNAVTIGGEILQSYGSIVGGNIKEINTFFRWDFSGFLDHLSYLAQYPFIYFSFFITRKLFFFSFSF